MNKNQIIEKLFTGKNFRDCIAKMEPAHLRDDLKGEVALILCEMPEDKVIDLHAKQVFEFYVVRIILNLIQNSSNQFHKKFRQSFVPIEINGHKQGFKHGEDYTAVGKYRRAFEKNEVDIQVTDASDIEDREMREAIEDTAMEEINRLHWYDAELMRIYMRVGNFRAMEAETGIPYISCYKNVKKSMGILKKKATDAVSLFTKKELSFIQNNKP